MERDRLKEIKDWACQECGKLYTARAAERAMSSGCSRCGGTDLDLAEEEPER